MRSALKHQVGWFRTLAMGAFGVGILVLIQSVGASQVYAQPPTSHVTPDLPEQRHALSAATSWGYQLQGVEPTVLAATQYDVLVIDYSRDGSGREEVSPAELAVLSHKPDGSRRLVFAYMSIGEAEAYRFYWNERWQTKPPHWLGAENPDWPGNYAVQYWDRDWQGLIFGTPGAYLDRIIGAGFDGVYLDRVDAFATPSADLTLPARLAKMSGFVESIASYARGKKSDFLVLAQNGEELLADDTYRSSIDGLAKEDLFFGIDGDGVPNSHADVRASLSFIEPFIAAGKPVFLVEYLSDADEIAAVRKSATQLNVPVFFGDRELDHAQSH